MNDPDAGVRYWGVMGVLIRGAGEVRKMHESLAKALHDASPSVRIAAAEALGKYGSDQDLKAVLTLLIRIGGLGKE